MRQIAPGGTPIQPRAGVFIRRVVPVLLSLPWLVIASCGDGRSAANTSQPLKQVSSEPNPESVIEQPVKSTGHVAEPSAKQGISDRKDPVVVIKGDDGQLDDANQATSKEPSQLQQGLPDLSLLQEPDFQRRAKLGHLVAKKRCILCHKIDGRGGVLQPPLIQVSVRRLERMKLFTNHLEMMRKEDPNRYEARKEQFLAIEKEPDLLRKMSRWLHGYLKQPTFDNAQAKMPLQVLKPEEVDQLASYVIQLSIEGLREGVKPLE